MEASHPRPLPKKTWYMVFGAIEISPRLCNPEVCYFGASLGHNPSYQALGSPFDPWAAVSYLNPKI